MPNPLDLSGLLSNTAQPVDQGRFAGWMQARPLSSLVQALTGTGTPPAMQAPTPIALPQLQQGPGYHLLGAAPAPRYLDL